MDFPPAPVGVTHASDGSGRLFVSDQRGLIYILRNGAVLPEPFLDISSRVKSDTYEEGFLGLAFHPQYRTNGQFFVYYNNRQGDVVLARFNVSRDPDRADANSESLLLTVTKPFSTHNAGQLAFGPDGYLYIGIGDGGGTGDPFGNAQNLRVLLGKILRLDVDHGMPYAIPPTNPFVASTTARHEIWAYGLRNPWRFSFDRVTGNLYIGDVGQGNWEEINFQASAASGGQNYGWNVMEGKHCYPPGARCDSQAYTLPIVDYAHQGCSSVTGGYVYRGRLYPLVGAYLYADYCQGQFWALTRTGETWVSTPLLDTQLLVSSFGEDEDGELYVTTVDPGGFYRLVARAR